MIYTTASARSRPRLFRIATLSFAKCGKKMVLSPKERVRLILAAATVYEPDLLITAGYAVHSLEHLNKVARGFARHGYRGLLITEVHYDQPGKATRRMTHAMWAVHGSGEVYRLGPQIFGTSAEARAKRGARAARFAQRLHERTVTFHGLSAFGLCCGEINIVQGRTQPRFLNDDAAAAISKADIILNPTHDRMGNGGTLRAKRSFLSRQVIEGRNRLYVSCSNWESCGTNGKVQHPSPTLHTAYLSGQPLTYKEPADGSFGFVFRQWTAEL
ncbi:hypothetical protein [Sphingomonas montana]|uniref:hypothetical protein n=1 Tax=Sphingomonas montana TaxID=1843236 RepID=UPI00101AE9E2|nr:hypothetical protein [Sphingomonas montana]